MKRILIIAVLLFGLLIMGCGDSEKDTDNTDTGGDTPATETWQEVAIFSGAEDMTTDPFHISGDKFRLVWSITPSQTAIDYGVGGQVYGTAYIDGGMDYAGGFIAKSIMATENDETLVYKGSGDYYLKILAANCQSWEIKVEDYY